MLYSFIYVADSFYPDYTFICNFVLRKSTVDYDAVELTSLLELCHQITRELQTLQTPYSNTLSLATNIILGKNKNIIKKIIYLASHRKFKL